MKLKKQDSKLLKSALGSMPKPIHPKKHVKSVPKSSVNPEASSHGLESIVSNNQSQPTSHCWLNLSKFCFLSLPNVLQVTILWCGIRRWRKSGNGLSKEARPRTIRKLSQRWVCFWSNQASIIKVFCSLLRLRWCDCGRDYFIVIGCRTSH